MDDGARPPAGVPGPSPKAAWVDPAVSLGTVAFHIKDFGDADFDLHASGVLTPRSNLVAPLFDRIATSFDDAVRVAISASRRSGLEQSQAVLQGADGAWYVTPVDHVKHGRYIAPGMIDGSRTKSIDFDRVHASARTTDLQALVGAYTWIDLRDGGRGDRSMLPKRP